MKKSYFGALLGVLGFALVVACSDDKESNGQQGFTDDDGGTSAEAGTDPKSKQLTLGKQMVEEAYHCNSCHTADMGGTTTPVAKFQPDATIYPKNLTPDKETGIGDWTDEELSIGIREGISKGGEVLCPQMLHYAEMSDEGVAAVIAYLRSLPPVKRVIPGSSCPPTKPVTL